MARSRLHYAWIVAGVTFVALMVSAGIRATPSVLLVPLEREFGWSRATTSSAVSVGLLLYGLIGPFCAAIAQRIGIRRTMSSALLLLAAAVLLATRVREPWQLVLLGGLFVGAGTGMVATVMGAVVVNRWFSSRRGVVLGALTGSTAGGAGRSTSSAARPWPSCRSQSSSCARGPRTSGSSPSAPRARRPRAR